MGGQGESSGALAGHVMGAYDAVVRSTLRKARKRLEDDGTPVDA